MTLQHYDNETFDSIYWNAIGAVGKQSQSWNTHGLPNMWGDITQRGDNSSGRSTGATQTVHDVENLMKIRRTLYIVNKPRHAIYAMILYYNCQKILEHTGPMRPYTRQ